MWSSSAARLSSNSPACSRRIEAKGESMGNTGWLKASAAAALLATSAGAASQGMTPAALADRAAISDLLTRYYNNFGNGVESKVGEYYAPDGEMILGERHY